MNILLNCYEYPPSLHGGVGTFSRDLAEGLIKNGHTVTVIGIYKPHIQKVDHVTINNVNGVRVIRIPSPFPHIEPHIRLFAERFYFSNYVTNLCNLEKFDIIESPDATGWLALGKLPCVPKISRSHGGQIFIDNELNRKPSYLFHYFEKKWLDRADFVVGVSKYVIERTLDLASINKPYKVIYNAIDIKKMDINRSRIKHKEKGLIAFFGTVSEKKGIENLIKAFPYVVKSVPYARLMIIGKHYDRLVNGKPYYEILLNSLPIAIQRKIEFLGWIPNEELINILPKAEVCCLPSLVESFSLAPMESMALGLPTVFMKNGSGPEIINDQVDGLLCDSSDPSNIAEKIIKLLTNEDLAKTISSNSRTKIITNFNSENWIKENINFYQKCIENYGK